MEVCSIYHSLLLALISILAGTNPLTGDRVFEERTVVNCLSHMYGSYVPSDPPDHLSICRLSSGMYDASGEFMFRLGFPCMGARSGPPRLER